MADRDGTIPGISELHQMFALQAAGLVSGCPAVARGTNGDFYADDPQCWASEENGLLRPRKEGKDR